MARLVALVLAGLLAVYALQRRVSEGGRPGVLGGEALRGLQGRLYVKNAARPGDPALMLEYKAVNDRHFGGTLPALPVTWEEELEARRLDGLWTARDQDARIFLNPRLKGDARELRRALCHEMVHEWLFVRGDAKTNHGPPFRAMLKRLAEEGAFDGILATAAERDALKADLLKEREALLELQADLKALASDPALHDAAARGYNDRLEGFNAGAERFNRMMLLPDDGEAYAAEASLTLK